MLRPGLWTLVCVGLCTSLTARADEEKVPLDKVPPAVTKAVKAKFPNGTLKQAEKEVEDGKTVYEIGLEDGGRKLDVSVNEQGTILAIEKQIAESELPKPVKDAVKAKYPNATIKKAEEITKDTTKSFEVILAVGDKQREVVLDPAGKILEDEEAGED